MSTVQPIPQRVTSPSDLPGPELSELPELRIYSHSRLFYWWPVWVVGFLIALLTYAEGHLVELHGVKMWMSASKNPGVLFTVLVMMVVLFTNVSMRGVISVVTILAVMFLTVLFAYLGWWDEILRWIPYLSIHMNMGFYVFFSLALFIMWVLAFFVFDRLSFYRVRPGQMTLEYIIGGSERSWDTRGMVAELLPQDLFRNWILGLGTGDLHLMVTGARSEELIIPNVLFARRKVRAIQKLIAVKPEHLAEQVVKM
jgi:hypothetical protein